MLRMMNKAQYTTEEINQRAAEQSAACFDTQSGQSGTETDQEKDRARTKTDPESVKSGAESDPEMVHHGSVLATRKGRRQYLFKQIAEIAALGIVYLIWVELTGLGIPCPIRFVTGYQCPGCGITHYVLAMAHLDLHEAYVANQLIFVLMPFLLGYGIYRAVRYVRSGRQKYSVPEVIAFTVLLIIAIVFAVWRNL